MKFYLCKYIPPRADFLATMTAEESKWMKQHGDFLNNLLDKGLIVAHGPVMDPSGGYGVSLYQIADDQDIAGPACRSYHARSHSAGENPALQL